MCRCHVLDTIHGSVRVSNVGKAICSFELILQLARSSQIRCSMHANQCSKTKAQVFVQCVRTT